MKNLRDQVLFQRYLAKDKNGKVIETEREMFMRVASFIACVESKYDHDKDSIKKLTDRFYELMSSGTFLPNTPTLMNAGKTNPMLSACFVLPIEDSIDEIFTTVKNTALIQKAGGGTGFSFDQLRPTGDLVTSSGGKTSGPISFWKVLSQATSAIQQGAYRRGANMGMMSIDHPDILKFISAKKDLSEFTNFNISVKITDDFMTRLKKEPGKPHIVKNPRTGQKYLIPKSINANTYTIDDLVTIDNSDAKYYTTANIWQIIIQNAHKTGEPGVCFINNINKDNPTPDAGIIEATNPCGEQPLLPYEACNLGSINLAKFVSTDGKSFDWPGLLEVIDDAVAFLDNVIDANSYPIKEIKDITLANRKIGLGVMGFADTLVLLGIRYDSNQAIDFALQLSSFIQGRAHKASESLAQIKGCFPNYHGSIWHKQDKLMRNASVTTIAPTGSISIIAGCNGGIEPIYSLVSKRKALDGQEFTEFHPVIANQKWLTDSVKEKLIKGIHPKDISEIPEKLSSAIVTAHQIPPRWHVHIQSAFQEYTDNAVSKTVNLPSNAIIEDVDKIFRLAYELNCKGITVYRDGCRDNQVISTLNKHSDLIITRPRIRKTSGQTTKFTMGCGKLYVSVNKDDKGLCEVFSNLGKAGGCPAQSEATCRIVSAALRSGVNPEILIRQLKGIRCLSTISQRKTNKNIDVLSCPDAIARAIEEAMGQNSDNISSTNQCPDCGHGLRKDSGCNICDNCGYSKCS